MEPRYYQAEHSARRHSIADGFNLWGLCGTAWINYATAPTREGVEQSKRHHPHVAAWRVVPGYGLPA
jgi:hypothetical protein